MKQIPKSSLAITIALLTVTLTACNGSGKGLDENGQPLVSNNNNPSPTTNGNISSTFADIQSKVLTKAVRFLVVT